MFSYKVKQDDNIVFVLDNQGMEGEACRQGNQQDARKRRQAD
jgi:hypothetical protein